MAKATHSVRFPGESAEYRRARDELLRDEVADSLILYSFMFGPEMERPCPSCTSILDGLNGYNRDYHGEDDDGDQIPALNVFVRRDTELLYADPDKGQDPRHVDFIWLIWNLFDLVPEGRGADWNPRLEYPKSRA